MTEKEGKRIQSIQDEALRATVDRVQLKLVDEMAVQLKDIRDNIVAGANSLAEENLQTIRRMVDVLEDLIPLCDEFFSGYSPPPPNSLKRFPKKLLNKSKTPERGGRR